MMRDLIRFSFVVVAALAVLAVASSTGLAAGDAHKTGHTGPIEGGVGFFDIKRYDLGIYTLLIFGLLFLILAKFAWGPFNEGLAKREATIREARDEALKVKADTEKLQKELKAEFAAASDKIRAMMDEARKDADVLRAKEREVGVKEAAAERERAKREIDVAKDQALDEIYKKSVEVAALISSKAIRRNMTAADHSRLIDEALSDLKTSVSRN
jgi:F-type H+-transporting ATPase subunit b